MSNDTNHQRGNNRDAAGEPVHLEPPAGSQRAISSGSSFSL
jgi:hypothetical protein